MKMKLKTVFICVIVALTGIVMFQVYWCINAYKVNKKNFDGNIDIAMQKAMDDCKKDYFDSIRVVLIRRLNDTAIKIRIDTLHEADTIHKQLIIHIAARHMDNSPFYTTNLVYNYYANKIGRHPTIPQVLTEMSFYQPNLMMKFSVTLGGMDIMNNYAQLTAFLDAHPNVPGDSLMAHNQIITGGVYELPPNYRQADSLKLHNYLVGELHKMDIYSPFGFHFSLRSDTSHISNAHYSETNEYAYAYHGFVFLKFTNQEPQFYVKAVFRKPQYAIITNMLFILVLSVLLIALAIGGINYLIKTVLLQKKLAEMKDDFINNMTHELKTPIATMTVAIEGLQKFNALNDPEKTQRYLQTSRNELARLYDLVSKALNVAAFENNEIKLLKEETDIDEMIGSVIESEKLKSGKNINIIYQNTRNIGSVKVDKLHFRNVISNLLDNAIKYSNEPVQITITTSKNSGNFIFSIRDNGKGIPPAHLDLIFDKFHRVPAGDVHDVKGTGLGLSYVKYIVEAHGGTISVKSEIDAGSEFIVSIPIN
ncbi:MAG TPA: HAMP domain-containing sensor histidine kinase [Mucilaginibacter sp.]|nr:HAMP domain-containing sensor histidine kinase [Mucilaginibacter sp.]